MDRQIVYPGSIPLDTDILNIQRNTLIALGYLTQATLGTASIVDGLACMPSEPGSLSVTVGPGCITQFGDIDTTNFGSLPALPTAPLVRMGINVNNTDFTLTAPSAEGQVITYLLEASLLEQDANAIVLPYYNAANPGQPYSGPNNAGTAQMTSRIQAVQFQLKAGAPAAIGSAAAPATDAGWVGLYSITVEFGQSAIEATSITVLPSAPFLSWKLPELTPGTRNLAVFGPTTQGNWTVPAGVSTVKLRLWGGGGAGGNGFAGAGGGGAGGGYSEGFYAVGAGERFIVTVGNGGAGAGSAGGTSSFGNLASASGGLAGGNGGSGTGGSGGGTGGVGSGTGLIVDGSPGGSAFGASGSWLSGSGGGAFGGGGALSMTGLASEAIAGGNGVAVGAGGSGGIGSGLGGQGAPGAVLVEW